MRFEYRANSTWTELDQDYIPEVVFFRERDARVDREVGEAATLFLGDNYIKPFEIVFRARKSFVNTADTLTLRDYFKGVLPDVDMLRYGYREVNIIAAFFEMHYVDTMQSVEVTLKFIPGDTDGLRESVILV